MERSFRRMLMYKLTNVESEGCSVTVLYVDIENDSE